MRDRTGMSLVRREVRRAAYEVKTIVALYPALAIPIARRRHGVPVGKDTRLVIEGFPRSGTSFATTAFAMAQPHDVEVAQHVHAPAQVIAAARAGIPALVLVRDPEATILSFVVRHPHVGLRQALRGYLRFYEPLVPHLRHFVVGLFPDVTSDFGEAIRRVNRRYGTSFSEFDHTEDNVRACLDALDRDYRGWVGAGERLESIVPRPSAVRERMKDANRATYRSERLAGLRARAERAYEAFARRRAD